jgi:hypothetical protein
MLTNGDVNLTGLTKNSKPKKQCCVKYSKVFPKNHQNLKSFLKHCYVFTHCSCK